MFRLPKGALPALSAVLMALVVPLQACSTAGHGSGERIRVDGTTRMGEKRLTEGTVTAHRGSPSGTGISFPIQPDGSFAMLLPAGSYYITGSGRGEPAGEILWAFYSGNPLAVFGPPADPLVLRYAPLPPPPEETAREGISGVVLHEGSPVPGAVVGLYLDDLQGFHGPPFAVSPPSDGMGRFSISVPPGTYYLLARARPLGGFFHGPLLKGDLAGYYPHNPVTARSGNGMELLIPVVEVNRPRGEGSHSPGQAVLIRGTIRLESGEPAAGLRVCLYDTPEMLGRPAFVSSPSDGQGRYSLELSRGGVFFMVARERIGGPPEAGDLMGFYQGSGDHSVALSWGDRLEDVDFTVRESF